jgi:hypothetical protein
LHRRHTCPASRALNDPRKIRTDAQLAVIFITDTNEQSDGRYARATQGTYVGDAIATHSLPAWQAFFSNFDGLNDPILSRALVHGILCPNGGDCTDEGDQVPGNEPYMNPRYANFIANLGGVEAALPDDTDPLRNQKIADAIALIPTRSRSSCSRRSRKRRRTRCRRRRSARRSRSR